MRPTMSPDEAISEIGVERGELTWIAREQHAAMKKYLSAMGIPSSYVATKMRFGDMIDAYNDVTDATIAKHIEIARSMAPSSVPVADPVSAPPHVAATVTVMPTVAPQPAPMVPATPITVAAHEVATNDEMGWDSLLAHLAQTQVIPGIVNRILLYGPPRTGKSTSAAQTFAPTERITMHKQQPVDDLLGGYCLQNGSTVWSDGPAIRALRYGRKLIIDEICQMSGECRFTLHALMDDPAGITLASGERVHAAPGYAVIGTTNAPPSALPLPILDRFDMVLHCQTISSGLAARLGRLAAPAQRSVTSMAMWTRPASPNLLLAAAKLSDSGIKADDIARILYPGQITNQADLLTLLAVSK